MFHCPEISNINENNEKIINNEHEISKLIKALPKDIAALDKSGKEHPTDERWADM